VTTKATDFVGTVARSLEGATCDFPDCEQGLTWETACGGYCPEHANLIKDHLSSVTPLKPPPSRNGYHDCVVAGGGALCHPWYSHWLSLHCAACHSNRHRACRTCMACLPDWHNYRNPRRIDSLYCSSACRQKAYRKRRATA